jgi:hypothetical protein
MRTNSTSALACLLLWGALLMGHSASAQAVGKLRFIVDPGGNYSFILDHQYRMQQREVELSAGPHHFTFWAPERRMVDTTVQVEAGVQRDLILRLPYSQAFMDFRRDMQAYRNSRKVNRLLPMGLTAASAGWTIVNYFKYANARDQLNTDLETYDRLVSPREVTILKDQTIPRHQDEFKSAENRFRLSAGVTILAAGITTVMYMRSAKRSVPIFHDSEKVRFEGLVWLPDAKGDVWLAGLTIPLR